MLLLARDILPIYSAMTSLLQFSNCFNVIEECSPAFFPDEVFSDLGNRQFLLAVKSIEIPLVEPFLDPLSNQCWTA